MQELNFVQNNQNESTGFGINTGRIILSLSAIAAFTKVFGFAEKLVIANLFGTGETADVYFVSMGIILSVVFLAKELIYPSLLPVFTDSLSKPAYVSAALFRMVLLSAAVLLAAASLIQVVFSDFFTNIFAPGFSESKKQLTSAMLRLLTPAMLFLGLSTVTYTVLNARKKFLQAAWPELAARFFVVTGLIALVPILKIYALAAVAGVAAIGCFLAQFYFIPERKFLFKCEFPETGSYFKNVLVLMGPLVIGVIFSHIGGLVDNMLASALPSGQLSYLGYSKKLIDAILVIGTLPLVTVVYSQLSHLASSQDYYEFRRLVANAFRLLLYVSVPLACLLVILNQPLIRILFERGRFGSESTLGTSQAFMVYACGLVSFSLESLIVYCFFALSNTKTPVKVGIFCVCLDVAMAILFLKPFGCLGIAGAMVIAKTVKVVILFALLNRELKGVFFPSILSFSVKLSAATIAACLVLKLLSGIETADSFFHRAVFDLMLPSVGFLSTLIFMSYLLRIGECREIASLISHRKAK